MDGNSGAMHTGWYQVNGSWYYSDGSGKVEAGRWMNEGETWYYLSGSGAAFTGWRKDWKYLVLFTMMIAVWQRIPRSIITMSIATGS